MKKLLFVLALVGAVNAELLTYNTEAENLADGDTFAVDLAYAPVLDSIQSIINGRLGNNNFASDAALTQRLIDSTSSHASDWIYPYTRRIWKWATGQLEMHSGRGISAYINDTTANAYAFKLYSDSTTLLMQVDDDSIRVNVPFRNFQVDSIAARDDTVHFTGKVKIDSLYGNTGSSFDSCAGCTFGGWDAYTLNVVAKKKIGKMVTYYFSVYGSADDDSLAASSAHIWLEDTCALGFGVSQNLPSIMGAAALGDSATTAGLTDPGILLITPGTNHVQLYYNNAFDSPLGGTYLYLNYGSITFPTKH